MNLEERPSGRSRKSSCNASLPITLLEVIDRIADAESVSFNEILERVVRKGLVVERGEREGALRAVSA